MFAGIFIYFFFYILMCTKRSPITSTGFFAPSSAILRETFSEYLLSSNKY